MSEILTDSPSRSQDPVSGGRPNRWAVWRSAPDQPRWARPVLAGIVVVAAVLYAWNLSRVDYAPLYSEAVKGMSESWKALFYGAIDAKATVTLDKLAGSLVPQAISARIFGYHAWSLALPQVIEGIISVLVMYRIVRRWAGVVPGLLAAGIFTLTPVAASMFGHSMEDGALIMCLVLAVNAYQVAVTHGRLRPLVWAGVWVGLAFQTKMLQAWMILPALAIGYLLTAPIELRRRWAHLGIAGTVMVAVSLSWVALYTFTPASDRPYINGTTNNSALTMVFGFNGLGRLGIDVPGAVPVDGSVQSMIGPGDQLPGGGQEQAAGGGQEQAAGGGQEQLPGGGQEQAAGGEAEDQPGEGPDVRSEQEAGWNKLLSGRLGVAIGWLYPLALLTLFYGLWRSRRAERTDPVRGGIVMWGVWLLTFGVIFSATAVPHTAYVAALAPAIAALSALGIVMFWRAYRAGGRQAWMLPLAVAAELAWGAWLWSGFPQFLPWARGGTLALGVAALLVLVLARVTRAASTVLVNAGLAAGVAAMLAAPAVYAVSVLDPRYSGTSFDADAGPASSSATNGSGG